jgi:RNase P subunit RPR2
VNKTCLKCGENKPVDAFGKDAQKSDGKRPYCKLCARAMTKANEDRVRARGQYATPAKKLCAACQENKPKECFTPHRGKADGLHAYCKPCAARRTAQSRAARGNR